MTHRFRTTVLCNARARKVFQVFGRWCGRIVRFDRQISTMAGRVLVAPDGASAVLATLPDNNLSHVTGWGSDLYVAARGAHQIFKVNMAGGVHLVAGAADEYASFALTSCPGMNPSDTLSSLDNLGK